MTEKEEKYIKIPAFCPFCGEKTKILQENESEVLLCTNPSCNGRFISLLSFFVSRKATNIDGLSEATLELLINQKFITKYEDIYKLYTHRSELETLPGLGKKSVDNLLSSIEKSRNISLENFINALSITDVGFATAKLLADFCNNDISDFLKKLSSENTDFTEIDGIGEQTNSAIHDWWRACGKPVENLSKEFKFLPKNTPKITNKIPILFEKKFCITGSFPQSREILQKKIENLGGKFVSSVSKKTDILFVGENAGSKRKKAEDLGIKIIEKEELYRILGEKDD